MLPRWFEDKSLRKSFILRKIYIVNMGKKQNKTNDTIISWVVPLLHFVEGEGIVHTWKL